jgi:hypothetical protein
VIGNQPFDRSNSDGFIDDPPDAFHLAGMVTDPTANQGKGIRIPDNLHRFIEFPFRGRDDVPRNIHSDGAGFAAGRPPVGGLSIDHRNDFSIDHLGNKVALLMTP